MCEVNVDVSHLRCMGMCEALCGTSGWSKYGMNARTVVLSGTSTGIVQVPQCPVCPIGQYQPRPGSTACIACVAGKKRVVSVLASSEESSACQPCPAGTYQEHDGMLSCVACGVGKYRNDRASSSPEAAACTLCDLSGVGSYQDKLGQVACTPKRTCPAGQGQSVHGGVWSDRECASCVAVVSGQDPRSSRPSPARGAVHRLRGWLTANRRAPRGPLLAVRRWHRCGPGLW